MLTTSAVDRMVSASTNVSANDRIISSINHVAVKQGLHLLAQNSARLAADETLDASEREHHAQISRMATR